MSGRHSQAETGMLMMVAAMLLLPCIDAIAKSLSGLIPPAEIALARFILQCVVLAPFVLRRGRGLGFGMSSGQILANAARGALIALATLIFFRALHFLPMADAIGIFFVEPLLLTLLTPWLLKEKVGWRRMLAVGVGFIGALLVIQPSFEQAGWPALLPLGAALCFALYLVLTRKLAVQIDPVVMQFHAGLFGGLTAASALLLGYVTGWMPQVIMPVVPDLPQVGLLALLGLIATVGHVLVVHAFRRADAGILAPFQYLEIISATLLGYLIFGDFPDGPRWLGIGIIVCSGLYVFYRERRVQAESSTP